MSRLEDLTISLVTGMDKIARLLGKWLDKHLDNVLAILIGAGLITAALGFGAKSMNKDVVSGIFIISENQYRVGDVVEIGGAQRDAPRPPQGL